MGRPLGFVGSALFGAALLSGVQPAAAQTRAEACLNESNRLASAMLDAPTQQQLAGGRQGAKLEDHQKNRMRDLLDDARTAARDGDAERCMEHLRNARMEARNSGVGGRGGGSIGSDDTNSGTASSGGSPGISPGTPGLGQGSASPDSIGTSGSTGSAGSRGPAGGTGLGGGTGSSMGGGSMGGSGGAGSSGGGM